MGEGLASSGTTQEKIRWAPKVRPERIRRLYERDALGIVDDELIDDVGLALHARCVSIALVNDGRVVCPGCATEFKVARTYRERTKGETPDDPERVVPCPRTGCGWETTVGRWHQSWRHRELHAGWGLPALRAFAEGYPAATTAQTRMLLVDQLLHTFHQDLRRSTPGRSVAHNLIEGNQRQTLALLDSLAYGDHSPPERRATYAVLRAAGAAAGSGRGRGRPDHVVRAAALGYTIFDFGLPARRARCATIEPLRSGRRGRGDGRQDRGGAAYCHPQRGGCSTWGTRTGRVRPTAAASSPARSAPASPPGSARRVRLRRWPPAGPRRGEPGAAPSSRRRAG